MCFHYKQTKNGTQLEKQFNRSLKKGINIEPVTYVNGFSFPKVPIIDNESNMISLGQWGLLPSFTQDKLFAKNTLNAKIETLNTKVSFRNVISNRCLILADGFYEWKWLNTKGTHKQKYYITNQYDAIAMAGIYNQWFDKEQQDSVMTVSIITTQANELMSEIHNHKKRMPIIIKPNDYNSWLGGESYQNFAYPYQSDLIANKVIEDNSQLSLF